MIENKKKIISCSFGVIISLILLFLLFYCVPKKNDKTDESGGLNNCNSLEEKNNMNTKVVNELLDVLVLDDEKIDVYAASLLACKEYDSSIDVSSELQKRNEMSSELKLKLKGEKDLKSKIKIAKEYFFNELGFISLQDLTNPKSLLLPDVLARREGNCVALSVLFLSVCRSAGIPLSICTAPRHMFVRYNDGQNDINIETIEKGNIYDNKFYIDKYKIPLDMIEIGYYMAPLSNKQIIGEFLYNMSGMYQLENNANKAILFLNLSLDFAPNILAAHMMLTFLYRDNGRKLEAQQQLIKWKASIKKIGLVLDDQSKHLLSNIEKSLLTP